MKVGAILPCFRSSREAVWVVQECLKQVELVVCIDDLCPEQTGAVIKKAYADEPRVIVLIHAYNQGVGGAVKTGISYLLNTDIDVFVKVDSDGQMNPALIPKLVRPILEGATQFSKGNRFRDIDILRQMPVIRLIGNAGLSFITKLSTGYWELFDPTNGFLAMSRSIFDSIQIEKTDNRYFFETDLLFRCALANTKIEEIPMQAIYRRERSSLNPFEEILRFARRHISVLFKRIVYQYFLLEINPGSFELLGGLMSGLIALFIGLNSLCSGWRNGQETPAGTQTLFLALMIISLQLILGFVYYDSAFRPLIREIKSRT